jgi:hypothetical protein
MMGEDWMDEASLDSLVSAAVRFTNLLQERAAEDATRTDSYHAASDEVQGLVSGAVDAWRRQDAEALADCLYALTSVGRFLIDQLLLRDDDDLSEAWDQVRACAVTLRFGPAGPPPPESDP